MGKLPELKPVTNLCVKLDLKAWGLADQQQLEQAEHSRWQLVKAAQDVLANAQLTTVEREAAEKIVELFDWVAPVGIGDDIAPF